MLPEQTARREYSDSTRSWMLPGTKREDLLYVADARLVRVYALPKAKLVGTLKVSDGPDGECSSASTGDIFIVEGPTIVEYAHGGTTPIETLNESGDDAWSCAVDATTGNLAVTNVVDPLEVSIFPGATGPPTNYDLPGMALAYDCVYDDSGDLFVAGLTSPGYAFALDELKKGSSSLFTVGLKNIGKTSASAYAGLAWDSKYVVLASDTDAYRYKIHGGVGTPEGATVFKGASEVYGMWLGLNEIIVPSDGTENVLFYEYPAGGNPTKTITGFSQPRAATVSKVSGR